MESESETTTAFSQSIVTPEPTDIPFDDREVISSAELPDKICTACLEENLIRSGVIEKFVTCQRCNEEFCIHGASKLDPQYCIHCCNDFKIIDVIESVQRPITNAKGEVTGVRQFRVRHITLSGLDWLFFNRAISSMSDLELAHAIEYHQSIYHGMIYEREVRRVQNSQRNKGKRAGNERNPIDGSVANPFVNTPDGVRFTTVNENGKKKTLRTRSVKISQSGVSASSKAPAKQMTPEAIQALVQQLMKAGLSPAQITALGKK